MTDTACRTTLDLDLTPRSLDACATNLQLLHEVGRVARRLQRHGIGCLAIKGFALLQTEYRDDPWARSMVDADLLVPTQYLTDAGRILEHMGFKRTPGEQSSYSRRQGELSLRIDLHGRLWYLDSEGLREFWARSYTPAGSPVRVPASEDHAILIAAHAVVLHGQLRPAWLEDLARLACSEIDWVTLLARTRRLRMQVPVGVALRAVAARGIAVPAGALDMLEPRGLDRWRARILSRFLARPEISDVGHLLRLLAPGRGPSLPRALCGQLFPSRSFLRRRYRKAEASSGSTLRYRVLRPYFTARRLVKVATRVALTNPATSSRRPGEAA